MEDKNSKNFDERLNQALDKRNPEQKEDALSQKGRDMSMAFRVITELVLSILICAGLGYWLDTAIGTVPVFMFVGILSGTIVGFVTVYKITNNMGYSIGFTRLHSEKKDAKSMCNETITDDEQRG